MSVELEMKSLRQYIELADPAFASELVARTTVANDFADVLQLCTMRVQGRRKGLFPQQARSCRLAAIGGANLHPLVDFVDHFVTVLGENDCNTWVGDYDNYYSEILEENSPLYGFRPDVVLLLPSERRCTFKGSLASARVDQEAEARRVVDDVLHLCETIHARSGAEVIVGNFRLPPYFDPGPLRATSLFSDYAFRKFVNMDLGSRIPAFVHICDIEFLSNRRGNLSGVDDRIWFESKQPFAPGLLVDVARELAHLVSHRNTPAKKVVVLDLDNTLWGGVVGDDGLEGIELGTTSPRGEAFRDFQQYLLGLSKRGVLLAVCSKNDHEKAIEPFEKHPEMVLRLKDIACFKANWEPKSDNLRQIAQELNLGLDSMVFIDDNRAEIEIVNQFVPEVSTIWLEGDPSDFAPRLKDSRYFETRTVTAEDLLRVSQYKQEADRQELLKSSTDMGSYLDSLEMVGTIRSFNKLDAPRIAQLIVRSNQFNLTTRRRSEAEVLAIAEDPRYSAFIMRLADRFGDHGLISIVIGVVEGREFLVDTWLMSCRVLKRQVEEEVLNEILRRACAAGCERVVGEYLPTAKNGMVRDHYTRMGFAKVSDAPDGSAKFELDAASYQPIPTKIRLD
jgi:FkbH-like protein